MSRGEADRRRSDQPQGSLSLSPRTGVGENPELDHWLATPAHGVWVSTAGLGVAWLHLRLDRLPDVPGLAYGLVNIEMLPPEVQQ